MPRSVTYLAVASILVVLAPAAGSRNQTHGQSFVRGDADGSGSVAINDAVAALGYLFLGAPASCLAALDANGSDSLDLLDPVFLLNFLFLAGSSPPAPFPTCGVGAGLLDCVHHAACAGPPQPSTAQFLVTGALHTPRYGHTATPLLDGRVLILGGTDIEFLYTLSNAEIFDPDLALFPAPPSGTGGFIDTDLVGLPMHMTTTRAFHSATRLMDGRVLIVGGSHDIYSADALATAEIFDPVARTFTATGSLILGRFDHTATLLPSGEVLIAGGQINYYGAPITFPSTITVELYDPIAGTFSTPLTTSGNPVVLPEARGRSTHDAVMLAGPDLQLGTPDDVLIFVGGHSTLSNTFAPPGKWYWFMTPRDTVLARDPWTGEIHTALSQMIPRSDAHAINLGTFQSTTPDGVDGVANVALVTGGFSDPVPTHGSEVLRATFAGTGPAGGLQLTRDYQQHHHRMNAEMMLFGSPVTGNSIGRLRAPTILLPTKRRMQGIATPTSWVLTVGGAHVYYIAGIRHETLEGLWGTNVVRGAMLFDPYYNPVHADPTDLTPTRTPTNPTGIVGFWLNVDAIVPDGDTFGFAGPDAASMNPLIAPTEGRVYHTASLIPGPDGVLGTDDDRVLIAGGGNSSMLHGGDPVSVSAEIFVQP